MSMSFRIGGKKLHVPAATEPWDLEERPGGWIIATGPDGRRIKLMAQFDKNRFTASSRGVLWHGEVIPEQREAAGNSRGDDSNLIAQFPGKVRKILVSDDAEVAEGDSLVLVEAMKMEFAIRAPFAGKVTRILVKEGQQIGPGDRFLDLAEGAKGDSRGA